MKKWIALLCMVTCIFGLTACGSEKELTEYEQEKIRLAMSKASEYVIPAIDSVLASPDGEAVLREFTSEEAAYTIYDSFNVETDGNVFLSALDSFKAAYEKIGGRMGIGEVTAELDGDNIIVSVEVLGREKDAQAEIVLSNDFFLTLKSAALNERATMKDLMVKAALNTLLGMGTVFIVLILISLIISCFNVIPKVQAMFSGKKADVRAEAIDSAVTQIVKQEESAAETDDLELAAVIAAAIAASEGAVSTDGFVVRSIRRRRAY